MEKLLLATRNRGKVKELAELLAVLPYDMVSLDDAGITGEVEETGTTFRENAILKAAAYVAVSGVLTLADDSGLEVDALDGRPGVSSARYGGPGLSDEDRVALVLEGLKDVPWERRTARFRCVIAIAGPGGDVRTVEGAVEGVIQYKPEGSNGFGYDPIFYLPEKQCTMAQLSSQEKNLISHRGQAAQRAAALLREEGMSPVAQG